MNKIYVISLLLLCTSSTFYSSRWYGGGGIGIGIVESYQERQPIYSGKIIDINVEIEIEDNIIEIDNRYDNDNNNSKVKREQEQLQYYSNQLVAISPYHAATLSDMNCLKQHLYSQVSYGCWYMGLANTNCQGNIQMAVNEGLSVNHIYILPDVSIGTGTGQMKKVITYLNSAGIDSVQLWIDVSPEGLWSNSNANQIYLQDMIKGCTQSSYQCGIRTDINSWTSIMGPNYNFGSSYNLWYVHNDGQASFQDWVQFGGWVTPTLKTYSLNATWTCIGANAAPALVYYNEN